MPTSHFSSNIPQLNFFFDSIWCSDLRFAGDGQTDWHFCFPACICNPVYIETWVCLGYAAKFVSDINNNTTIYPIAVSIYLNFLSIAHFHVYNLFPQQITNISLFPLPSYFRNADYFC